LTRNILFWADFWIEAYQALHNDSGKIEWGYDPVTPLAGRRKRQTAYSAMESK
jgi:hypothetical protein